MKKFQHHVGDDGVHQQIRPKHKQFCTQGNTSGNQEIRERYRKKVPTLATGENKIKLMETLIAHPHMCGLVVNGSYQQWLHPLIIIG
jgi:hypothetical protein